MAVADSVRVLQRHWVEARARAQTGGDQEPARSPPTVADAVLGLSTVGALCAGVGSGAILKRWTALTRLSPRPDPILVQQLRTAAASNEVCHALSTYYHEFLVAGAFPPPELLILPSKRLLSGRMTWPGVAELLESNRALRLVLERNPGAGSAGLCELADAALRARAGSGNYRGRAARGPRGNAAVGCGDTARTAVTGHSIGGRPDRACAHCRRSEGSPRPGGEGGEFPGPGQRTAS